MNEQEVKKLIIAVLVTGSTATTMAGKVYDAFKYYEMIENKINEDKAKRS